MDEIKVLVGTAYAMRNGQVQDDRVPVKFTGEQVAHRTTYGVHKGSPTDTRGTTETLYRASDGRLIIHVDEWSRWQGEPTTETIALVTEADLRPGGDYAALGLEAGYWDSMTLDEALQQPTWPLVDDTEYTGDRPFVITQEEAEALGLEVDTSDDD